LKKKFLDKNLQILKKTHQEVYKNLSSLQIKEELQLERSRSGEWTCKLESSEGSRYIHSKFKPSKETIHAFKSIDFEKKTRYILLGIGLGYNIFNLLKRITPDAAIFAIEKRAELISRSLEVFDWEKVLNDHRVHLIIGLPVNKVISVLYEKLKGDDLSSIVIIKRPQGSSLDISYYSEIERLLEAIVSKCVISLQSDDWGSGEQRFGVEMSHENLVRLAELLKNFNAKMELFCVMRYRTEDGRDIPFREKFPEETALINARDELFPSSHGLTHSIDTNHDAFDNTLYWREWDNLITNQAFSYAYQKARMEKVFSEFQETFGFRPESFVSAGNTHTSETESVLSELGINFIPVVALPLHHKKIGRKQSREEETAYNRLTSLGWLRSLYNEKIIWLYRLIGDKFVADLGEVDWKSVKLKGQILSSLIKKMWGRGKPVIFSIHHYNFLYEKGTKRYKFRGFELLDLILDDLSKEGKVQFLTTKEYGIYLLAKTKLSPPSNLDIDQPE
jgi:hypothetical protein